LPGVRGFAGRLGMLGGSVARPAVITGQFLHSEVTANSAAAARAAATAGIPKAFLSGRCAGTVGRFRFGADWARSALRPQKASQHRTD
jgi:hypothetical protein